MGYNTVAFFLNDQSDQVESDPMTVPRLRQAMRSGMGNDDRQYMTVLPSVHADGDQVIMAGGNRVTPITVFRHYVATAPRRLQTPPPIAAPARVWEV